MLAAALLAEVCTSGCSLLTQSNLNGPASGPEVSDSEKSDANKVIIENDFGYVVKDGYAMIVYYAGDLSATEVNIPATIGGYPVREIKEYLLSDMVSLKKLTIPQGVTEIGKYAFVSCESLEELTFPEGLTALSEGVCKYCKSLKVVTIPSTLTSVGDYAFAGCSSLETAICRNVVTMGSQCFWSDDKLKYVDCRNATLIKSEAFKRCSSLELIDLTGGNSVCTLSNVNAFNNTNNTWIAIVANDTIKSDFQNATNWSTFASHFRTIAEVEAEVGMTYDEYYYQLFGEPRNEVAA